MSAQEFGNAFERAAKRPLKYAGVWHTPDGEHLRVEGIIVCIGDGMIWQTRDSVATLPGGKPARRTPPTVTGNSLGNLQDNLERTFSRVSVYREPDELKSQMERDQRKRNLESSYTPTRGEKRVVVAEPARPKLIFGCDPSDSKSLGELADAAFFAWGADRAANDPEFRGDGMSPEQLAAAQQHMQANVGSMSRLLMYWGEKGTVKILTKETVRDAENYLRQHGNWVQLRRKRGEVLGSPWYPPEELAEPAQPQFDPRKATFEDLKARVLAERRQTMARKNLKGDEYAK